MAGKIIYAALVDAFEIMTNELGDGYLQAFAYISNEYALTQEQQNIFEQAIMVREGLR